MINKKNYEIWFLDYFEGNLSEQNIRILYDFLTNNPELKQEFDDFELLTLEKQDVIYSNKEQLKHNVNISSMQGLDVFETLAVKDIEGEITKEEKEELNSIIAFSAQKEKEYKAFVNTVLTSEKHITFDNKEKLKKKPGTVIPLWIKFVGSAAAIILLILFVKDIFDEKPENIDKNIKVVKTDTNKQKNKIHKQEIKTIVADNNISSKHVIQNVKNEIIQQKKHKNDKNPVVKPQKQLQNEENANNKIAYSHMKLSLPTKVNSYTLEKIDKKLKSVNLVARNHTKAIESQRKSIVMAALTPKEFFIREIKTKLEIDDKNYDRINPVELAAASLEKLNIAKMNYSENPNSKRKHFALNIAGFEIERSWVSN